MKSAQLQIHEQMFGEKGGRLSSAIQPSIGDFAVTPRPQGLRDAKPQARAL